MNKILTAVCMVMTIGVAHGMEKDSRCNYLFGCRQNNNPTSIIVNFTSEEKKETKTWTETKSLKNNWKNYKAGKPKHLKRRYDSKNEYNQKHK